MSHSGRGLVFISAGRKGGESHGCALNVPLLIAATYLVATASGRCRGPGGLEDHFNVQHLDQDGRRISPRFCHG